MDLQPSQTLSHYRLVEPIGEGGMGVVWKAVDTTLDREVAIKILPTAFAKDGDRLVRFEREAKLLASLNHPNIATIHGLHEDQGVRFLAMEFLGGADLNHVVELGPLPLDDVIGIARHIAVALEEAHRNGVVHRDLKPANVKVTDSKQVKVLDFGLARRQDATPAPGPDSDTVTQPGFIVGTAPYMSPEQVRGTPVDKQADIWAFGCVLYEMLTGQRAFDGETQSDILAAVLRTEPEYKNLPPETPRALQRVLQRCLEKDLRRRWHDMGDVRIELDELTDSLDDELTNEPAELPRSHAAVRLAPWFITLTAIAVAVGVSRQVPLQPTSVSATVTATIEPAAGHTLNSRYATVAVPSPDGSNVVYVGEFEGRQQLWLRSLDELVARPLAGTEDGWQPFFSSDGAWVGFFADRKLKKVCISSGPAESIVEIGGNPRGAAWGEDGWIVVSPTQTSGLIRVNADDGKTEPLTELDLVTGESTHRWPQILPAGRGVLYTARAEGTSFDQANIVVDPLNGANRKIVVEGGAHGRYVHSGHIAFVRGGRLFAAPFDLEQLAVTGEPVRVIDGVTYNRRNGGAQFAVSENGTLIYRPGAVQAAESRPVWIDRLGATDPIVVSQRAFDAPRVSPDGKRLLVRIFAGQQSTLWSLDIGRGTFSQITHRNSVGGRWVDPQGRYVVYGAGEPSRLSLFLRQVDGLSEPRQLTVANHRQQPCTVSPDGRFVVFQERRPETGWDLMLLELEPDGQPVGQPTQLLATPANEANAHFSRNGKFLAYESDEMDAVVQIYVRSFPKMEGKRQLSKSGARSPRFSRADDELYFWSTGLQQFRSVKYAVEAEALAPEPAEQLLAGAEFSIASGSGGSLADPSFAGYDVDPTSDRFVMLELEQARTPPHAGQVVLVLDWFRELNDSFNE